MIRTTFTSYASGGLAPYCGLVNLVVCCLFPIKFRICYNSQMNKEIAMKWFKQACHDLEMAERNIAIEGYDVAAFLAHQSVEKLMKSIFAIEGKKIPKSHYIDELAKTLNFSEEIIDEILDLTVDYTFARYPDVGEHIPYEEYDEEIARDKVKRAKKIFYLVKSAYNNLKELE